VTILKYESCIAVCLRCGGIFNDCYRECERIFFNWSNILWRYEWVHSVSFFDWWCMTLPWVSACFWNLDNTEVLLVIKDLFGVKHLLYLMYVLFAWGISQMQILVFRFWMSFVDAFLAPYQFSSSVVITGTYCTWLSEHIQQFFPCKILLSNFCTAWLTFLQVSMLLKAVRMLWWKRLAKLVLW